MDTTAILAFLPAFGIFQGWAQCINLSWKTRNGYNEATPRSHFSLFAGKSESKFHLFRVWSAILYKYHNSLPKKHLLNLFLSSKSSSSSWSFAVCPLLLDHLLVAASERALKVSSLYGVSHFGFIDGGKRNVFFPHYHIKYSFIVCCITYLLNYNCHLKHMQKSHE